MVYCSFYSKIVIYDMEESTFRLFLKFVYSGHLDMDKMSMEEIIEMLAVADRYEVCSCHILIMCWSCDADNLPADSFIKDTLWAITNWTSKGFNCLHLVSNCGSLFCNQSSGMFNLLLLCIWFVGSFDSDPCMTGDPGTFRRALNPFFKNVQNYQYNLNCYCGFCEYFFVRPTLITHNQRFLVEN